MGCGVSPFEKRRLLVKLDLFIASKYHGSRFLRSLLTKEKLPTLIHNCLKQRHPVNGGFRDRLAEIESISTDITDVYEKMVCSYATGDCGAAGTDCIQCLLGGAVLQYNTQP